MGKVSKEYVIIANSTCDLPQEMIDEFGIVVIPLKFSLNGINYTAYSDNRELSAKDFYDSIRNGGMPSTSQLNSEDFINAAKPYVEKGIGVLFLAFSSGLSGTYNSGRLAVEELKALYKDVDIEIIDTKCASLGEGLLVYYAALEKKKGLSITTVKRNVFLSVKKVCHYFTVTDINHLRRGGRISAISSLVAKLFSFKPILHVNDNGKLVNLEVVRGRKKSLLTLLELTKELIIDKSVVFISHADALEDATALAEMVKCNFGTEKIVINNIGPIIGAHAGPGTVAIFFAGKHR